MNATVKTILRNNNLLPFEPQIQIFEGFKSVWRIYTEALQSSKEKEILIYGTVTQKDRNTTDKMIFRLWMREIKNNYFKIKELLDDTRGNIKYARKVNHNGNPRHRVKIVPRKAQYLPRNMMKGDNIIYKKRLVLFSPYQEDTCAIMINHEQVSKIYKDLFKMSWKLANEY